jgi:hypothetical protein
LLQAHELGNFFLVFHRNVSTRFLRRHGVKCLCWMSASNSTALVTGILTVRLCELVTLGSMSILSSPQKTWGGNVLTEAAHEKRTKTRTTSCHVCITVKHLHLN